MIYLTAGVIAMALGCPRALATAPDTATAMQNGAIPFGFTAGELGIFASLLTLLITILALCRPVRPAKNGSVTKRVLPPVTLILAILFLVAGLIHWDQHRDHLKETSINHTRRLMATIENSLHTHQQGMETTLQAVAVNPETRLALRSGTASFLQNRWQEFHHFPRGKYPSGRFTFADSQRRVITRLHAPGETGDILNYPSVLQAEQTGRVVSGIELTTSGIVLLRVAFPVQEKNQRLGYLILSEEIGPILGDLPARTGTHLCVVLHKHLVDRGRWETSSAGKHQAAAWDRLPNSILAYSSKSPLSPAFDHLLDHHPTHGHNHLERGKEVYVEDSHWRLTAQSLHDLAGRDLGCLIALTDVSAEVAAFRRTILVSGLSGGAFLLALVTLLTVFLRRTDQRIDAQQEEIRRSEIRLQRVLEETPMGIIVADLKSQKFLLINRAITRMLGYSKEEMAGMTPPDLHPPEELPKILGAFSRVASGPTPATDIFQMRRKDGSVFPAEVQSGTVKLEGSTCAMGIFLDISARVEAEREAREREAQFRTFFDESPIPTYLLEPDSGAILKANPAACQSYGLSSLEELQRFDFWIDPPYSHADAIARMRELPGIGGALQTPWCSRRPDGSILKEQVYMRSIHCEGNDCALVLTVDITEREADRERLVELTRRLESAVNQANQLAVAAQAATVAKSEFINNLSHELRTPMNGILGLLDLLEDEPLGPTAREYTAMMRESGDRMVDMVNQIMTFADLETTRTDLQLEPVELRSIIRPRAANLASLCQRKGLTFRFRVWPETPPVLHTDAFHLRRILLNLGKNAVEFTERGRVSLRVLPDPSREGFVRFEFSDSGPGIPPEQEEHLFEPFWQADGSLSRKHDGLGLGLSVSKLLVQALGGEIGFRNRPEGGAVFWFAIPARYQEPRQPKEQGAGAILLVEDDQTNAMVASHILETMAHAHQVAACGESALLAMREKRFDLILLDIQLPRMDGFEVVKALRTSSGWATPADTPVIAVTAFPFTADRRRCLQTGANDFVSKPYSSTRLRAVIEKWIATSVPARE